MHHGSSLHDQLSEVHLQDLSRGAAKAGKPEALAIAQRIAREGEDRVAGEIPSPLLADPQTMHRYQIGELKIQDLVTAKPYPIVNGGAWVTGKGRLIVVELRGSVNEVTSAEVRRAMAMRRTPTTSDVPPVTVDLGTQDVKPANDDGLTKNDEGTSVTVMISSRSPTLYREEWNADDRVQAMADHSYFHLNDENSLPWRPLTIAAYARLVQGVLGAKRAGAAKTQQLAPSPASAPGTPPGRLQGTPRPTA